MQNIIACKNCHTENPFYRLTCLKCSAYLRERIFNIDLWDIIQKLIESPSKAFSRIIHAEHKNFIFFILMFAAIKLSILSVYFSLLLKGKNHYVGNAFVVFSITIGALIIISTVYSLLYTFVLGRWKNKTRFRDNLAINIYSLMPYVFALVLLFPIELILFGYTVFSVNPSPFIVKENLAYIMTGFEVLFVLWAIFLSFMGFRKQSGDLLKAFIFTFLFNFTLYGFLIYAAYYIYTV